MTMTDLQKRILLFLIGCVGTRSLIALMAMKANLTLLRYMGYISLAPAIGFAYIFLTGSRKTGPEVFGDKIWWNNLRPLHSVMYFSFAYNAIRGNRNAYLWLVLDVCIGLISFLRFHK